MSPRVLALIGLATALTLTGCGGGGDDTAGGSDGGDGAAGAQLTDSVDIKDFAYAPKTAKVKVGDTVTWTNQDSAQHDVDFTDKSFDSELQDKGGTITYTASNPGTFDYFCSAHQYMKGTLIVEA